MVASTARKWVRPIIHRVKQVRDQSKVLTSDTALMEPQRARCLVSSSPVAFPDASPAGLFLEVTWDLSPRCQKLLSALRTGPDPATDLCISRRCPPGRVRVYRDVLCPKRKQAKNVLLSPVGFKAQQHKLNKTGVSEAWGPSEGSRTTYPPQAKALQYQLLQQTRCTRKSIEFKDT